jgi:hypothetical protein
MRAMQSAKAETKPFITRFKDPEDGKMGLFGWVPRRVACEMFRTSGPGYRRISWTEGNATKTRDAAYFSFAAHETPCEDFMQMVEVGGPAELVLFHADVSGDLSERMQAHVKRAGILVEIEN